MSCHSTLIRLGDLSRYRETELVSKDRNWGPAIGYYDLAAVIYPASGASHNQQAVIALADGNHFRATYHLYRALSAQEPHPSAKGNLEIEFRKIMSADAKGGLIRSEDVGVPARALAPSFVLLHAQCYKGNDFPRHEELESDVMNYLAVEIRERSLEGTLTKFCLVNVAAEAFARTRSNNESVSNAFVFFQRINVKTFFTLLQILLVELERFAGEDPNNKDTNGYPDKVTVVARRILPALRHYSSWLLTTSDLLIAEKEEMDSSLAIQIQEFWKIYASTLTLLASTFDILHLPEIDYLLEEDEESLGFAPLDQESTVRRYMSANDTLKPRTDDPDVERNHPNKEMLYRIREFVIDGLDLVVRNKIPVVLVDDDNKKTFIYQEDGLPTQIFSSPHVRQHTLENANIEREDIPRANQDLNSTGESRSTFDGSQSASASMSANMNRIVEGVERLVESDTYENPPSIPDQFDFYRDSGDMPTPLAQMRPSSRGFPYDEQSIKPQGMPMAPPGLGPPSANAADSLRMSLAQSYNSLPALPSIPSIWSTSSPGPLREGTPRTPPGLGPPSPLPPMTGSNIHGPDLSPSQSQISNELLRHSLIGQTPLSNPLDSHATTPSWMQSSGLSSMGPPPPHAWDRDQHARMNYNPYEPPSQAMPGSIPNQTWANEAFIASSMASARSATQNPPGLGPRKPSTQLGAIGQTSPCGQGG